MTGSQENKGAAATYILQLYEELHVLTHNSSLYNFSVIRVGATVGTSEKELSKSLSEEDMTLMKNLTQSIHTDAYKVALRIRMMKAEGVKDLETLKKKVDDCYKEIKEAYLPPADKLTSFVESAHTFMLSTIMEDLLVSSNSIVRSLASSSRVAS